VHGALCLVLAACATETAAPLPTVVVNIVVPDTPTATRTPPPTITATVTADPTPTTTPTLEATPTAAPSRTPRPAAPTLDLGRFPLPPATFSGEPHLFLARPIGAGGNVFVASNYRYGSTWSGQLETHHGVEFANPQGTPIVAVGSGTVYYAGSDAERQFGPSLNFYGNLVVLQLAQGWQGRPVFALYGHMDTVTVMPGQAVSAGETLGIVGSTGVAYGPHLHFEMRLDNPENYWATRNPELWLAPAGGSGVVALRVTNERGQHLPGMRVTLTCSDGAKRFLDTYWDTSVTPDDTYGENAAMTDVPAGYCKFETQLGDQTLALETTLTAGTVNFVWLKP
jgi:murein DD-endopeptidase MepM/ murein hydrolase activator NlpD